MKTVLFVLFWCGWAVGQVGAAPAVKDKDKDGDYKKIVLLLQKQTDFLVRTALKEEAVPKAILEEGEQEWERTMTQFRRMVASHDKESQADLITSKELLHAYWRRKCEVFFDQLAQPGARLRRYDEGVGGSTGYVITVQDQLKYWLPQRFTRE